MIWSQQEYLDAAFLARLAGDELISCLSFLTLQPKRVVFIGCVFKSMVEKVRLLYPEADLTIFAEKEINAVELSDLAVLAEPIKLPVLSHSVDIMIANFCLAWQQEPHQLMSEWQRVIKPNGILVFNAFGVNTLQDYRAIWGEAIIPGFSEVHNLGDSLIQAGFVDPVLDVNHYGVNYQDKNKMLRELQITEMLAIANEQHFIEFLQHLPTLQLNYEVITAHAFMPDHTLSGLKEGVTTISLDEMKQSLRRFKA